MTEKLEKEDTEIVELNDEDLESVSAGKRETKTVLSTPVLVVENEKNMQSDLNLLIKKIDDNAYIDFNGKKLLNGIHDMCS